MKPRQIANRMDAVTTQLYKAIIALEKSAEKLDDLAVACPDVSENYINSESDVDALKAAHANANQASYDLSGIASAIQDVIYKVDEAVSSLTTITEQP